MHNYFPSKIKATSTFPQDFSFLKMKKYQQCYLSEGELANWANSFSSVQNCTSPEEEKGRITPALATGEVENILQNRLDTCHMAVSSETPI